MPRTATIWFLTVFAYALFYAWYTGFAGPLSAEEIEIYLTRIAEAGDAAADRRPDRIRRGHLSLPAGCAGSAAPGAGKA